MAFEQGFVLRGLIVVLSIVSVILLVTHYNKANKQTDAFVDQPYDPNYSNDVYAMTQSSPRAVTAEDDDVIRPYDVSTDVQSGDGQETKQTQEWNASEAAGDEVYRSVDYPVNAPPAAKPGCFPRDKLSADDLLPKDAANSMWSQVMPAGQGDLSDKNFLTAGYHVGMSSSVIRNANYGLRSEPPNPQMVVSPWMNTTIDPDMMRRPLEVELAPSCSS